METSYTFTVIEDNEVIFTHDEELKTPEELLIDTVSATFNRGYEDAEVYAKQLNEKTKGLYDLESINACLEDMQ
ncbi:hypothetical protein [Rhodopseudomonas parapalustris]